MQGRNCAPVSKIDSITYSKPEAGNALLALAPWLSISGSQSQRCLIHFSYPLLQYGMGSAGHAHALISPPYSQWATTLLVQ